MQAEHRLPRIAPVGAAPLGAAPASRSQLSSVRALSAARAAFSRSRSAPAADPAMLACLGRLGAAGGGARAEITPQCFKRRQGADSKACSG